MKNQLPKSFYIVSFAAFLFQLTMFVTRPIFTLYILDLGASILQVGLILSIQSLLMIVMRIPLTMVAQRIGESRMISIAFIILSTSQLLYAVAPNPTWLYLIPFYQLIALGSFFQLATSMVSNMAPSARQGDALGRYMSILSIGMFIGPVVTSALVRHVSYRELFLVAALLPVVGLILQLRYSAGVKSRDPADRVMIGNGVLSSLKLILRGRTVPILSLIRTSYSMSNNMFMTLFAIYAVEDLGLDPSMVALLFSILGFSNTFIKFPAGKASDRFGQRNVLLFTFGTIVLNYLAIAYVRSIIPVAILIMVFGACWGARAVTEWSFLTSIVSPETKTFAISYMESFWDIGASIGSILAGVLAEGLPFSTIFLIAALTNVPAIPSIYVMEKPESN